MKRILAILFATAALSAFASAETALMEKAEDYVKIPELKAYLADVDVAAECFKLHRLDTKNAEVYALDGKTMIVAYIVGDGKAVADGKSGVRFNFAKLYKDTAKRLEFSCPATGEFRYVVLHGGIVPVFEKSCIMKLVK